MSQVNPTVVRQVAAVATAVLLALSSCSLFRDEAKTPMRLDVVSGSARIIRDSKNFSVAERAPIEVGDRIALSRGGVARVNLARGRSFELINGEVRISSTDRLELERGRVLATASAPATVSVDRLRVASSSGTFRVDRGISTRAAVYVGGARLSLGSDRLSLPRLRQVVVAEGILPGKEKPLRLDPADRWDQRILQVVLDLDARLANFGRGLEAQLGTGSGLDFFSRLVPGVGDLNFLAPLLGNRRSDLLIGLALASEASGTNPTSVGRTFSKAYGLWGEGASWGLIAFEFGVGQSSLFERLLDSLGRAGIFAAGRGPALARGLTTASGTSSTGGGGGSGSGPGGPGDGGGGEPPPPPPPPPPIIELPDPVQDIVDDIIGTLPRGLPGPPGPLGEDPLPELPNL